MQKLTYDQEYFDLMTSSLGDKKKILDYLIDGPTLDVGAGTGDLSKTIMKFGHETYSLDYSPESLEILRKIKGLHVLKGSSERLGNLLYPGFFSNIVCSSVLHEVFSYGHSNTGEYSWGAFNETLHHMRTLLKDGGRLIIRDGVIPTTNRTIRAHFTDPVELSDFLEEYVKDFPDFTKEEKLIVKGSSNQYIHLTMTDPYTLYGDEQSIMEFIYTFTWGIRSVHRESKEKYALFTRSEYAEYVQKYGFSLVHSEEYLQPGYREHLEERVSLYDSDNVKIDFPSSNQLLVFKADPYAWTN